MRIFLNMVETLPERPRPAGNLPKRQNAAGAGGLQAVVLAFCCRSPHIAPREVGGGRAARQPGQVRKEAALTSQMRVVVQPPTA